MTEDRVQIAIRTTKEQREEIREMAFAQNVTMNQFIIDAIFSDITDSNSKNEESDQASKLDSNATKDGSTVISLLEKQLEQKDKQIEKMQALLDQQQKLTLQTNQQFERLQLETTQFPKNEKNDSVQKTEELKKTDTSKGLFKKLFNL